MITLLLLLLFNSLVCLGFYQACVYEDATRQVDKGGFLNVETYKEKGLLWFIPYSFNTAPWWIRKPIYECLPCMASAHSYVYWIFMDPTTKNLMVYPVYILALAGMNLILDQITDVLS